MRELAVAVTTTPVMLLDFGDLRCNHFFKKNFLLMAESLGFKITRMQAEKHASSSLDGPDGQATLYCITLSGFVIFTPAGSTSPRFQAGSFLTPNKIWGLGCFPCKTCKQSTFPGLQFFPNSTLDSTVHCRNRSFCRNWKYVLEIGYVFFLNELFYFYSLQKHLL